MIFASLGIAQVNLALLSLIAKIIRFAYDFYFARNLTLFYDHFAVAAIEFETEAVGAVLDV
jgi:hypothetical protein